MSTGESSGGDEGRGRIGKRNEENDGEGPFVGERGLVRGEGLRIRVEER